MQIVEFRIWGNSTNMFSRVPTRLFLGLLPKAQSLQVIRGFSNSFLSADDCVLKKGEVYKFTDTGIYSTNS